MGHQPAPPSAPTGLSKNQQTAPKPETEPNRQRPRRGGAGETALARVSAGFLAPTKAPPSVTSWGEEPGTHRGGARRPGASSSGGPWKRKRGSTARTGPAPALLPFVSANSPNELTTIPFLAVPIVGAEAPVLASGFAMEAALPATRLHVASTGKATTSPRQHPPQKPLFQPNFCHFAPKTPPLPPEPPTTALRGTCRQSHRVPKPPFPAQFPHPPLCAPITCGAAGPVVPPATSRRRRSPVCRRRRAAGGCTPRCNRGG